jgi:hypothetical protein
MDEWKAWWHALAESERQSLRDIARASRKSLSYCAIVWGAEAER